MIVKSTFIGRAAKICDDYTNTDTGTGVYSNWYLPSKDELAKLCTNRTATGGFAACFPAHHLAYYFREVRKQTFSDYRNEWRISYAKKLIGEGKASGITLEAIGLQSGFVTRNTFLTAFKRAEGFSPSTYLAQISE